MAPVVGAEMAHLHDAVTYWNYKGYRHGPKNPEVRAWMLGPNNYKLEHFSVNRSDGAKQKQTYREPL